MGSTAGFLGSSIIVQYAAMVVWILGGFLGHAGFDTASILIAELNEIGNISSLIQYIAQLLALLKVGR